MNKPAIECLKRADSSWLDAYELHGQPSNYVCVRWYNTHGGYRLLVEGAGQPHMTRDFKDYDEAHNMLYEIIEMDVVTIERLQQRGFIGD